MGTPVPPDVGLGDFPFHIHLDVVGIVAALVVGYVYGVRRLAARHAPAGEPAVTGRQIAWFTGGVVLFLAVETWPLHDVATGSLFTAHMIEHMTLALLVPPMILNGTPWWLLRLVVKPVLPALRVLTRPLIALILFNAVLAAIHAPPVLEAMLSSEAVHVGFHAALILTATLMWWPVLGPIPDLPKLPPFMAMGYLFLQSLVPTIPASFLTFATEPVYEVYETLPRLWGISVMNDQLVAGLIMKIGGGVVLWSAITVIFFRWAAEEERASGPRVTQVRP